MFFVNGATLASWTPRLPELQADLGISDAALGVTLVGMGIGGLASSMFSGWLVDRRGSRTMTMTTSAAMSLWLPLLGIAPTVCATASILSLIEHEVPEHALVQLLSLRRENLEIVEVEIGAESPAAGRRIGELDLPRGCLLISVLRERHAMVPDGKTELQPGDQVLAIVEPETEEDLARQLLPVDRASAA